MPITTERLNYNVAKIIDTPWNTIINGLNYTKTNLAPLGLKYTYSASVDCGMLLKEYAGNSCVIGGPLEDFSWNCAEYDYDSPDIYWILNNNHRSRNTSYYFIRKAQRMIDENGFEYSEITNHTTRNTPNSSGKIICQTKDSLYLYINDTYYGATGNATGIYKVTKNALNPSISTLVSFNFGIIHILDVSDGYIWYYAHYGESLKATIGKIEISSGLNTEIKTISIGVCGSMTSYPTNIVDNSFYVFYYGTNNAYKYTFDNLRKNVTETIVSYDENESVYTTSSTSTIGDMKRFCHVYSEGNERYLVMVSLNSYHNQLMDNYSTIQTYKIDGNTLTRTQLIYIHGLSFIPKNNWNTWFIGESSGIRVFNWDSIEKKMYEKPTIYTTCQQFGFDIDERLWIMDVDYNITRYTFNQPMTIDYKFELEKYNIGTEIIETYVDVRVMNYMGDNLNANVKLKAIGNFTFINNQKELTISLSSDKYVRVPVYLNGSGKYEIRLK